jgi:hypothetical protein
MTLLPWVVGLMGLIALLSHALIDARMHKAKKPFTVVAVERVKR